MNRLVSERGFWLAFVSGPADLIGRVRLHLESSSAWGDWALASVVATFPDELNLLVTRLGSLGAGCPLTWLEVPYDPERESGPEWDEAWDDFTLGIELKLSDLSRGDGGALVLAAPEGLLGRLERCAPVLWRARALTLAVSHAGDALGFDPDDDLSRGRWSMDTTPATGLRTAFDRLDTARLLPVARQEPRSLPECVRVGRAALADGDVDTAFGALTRAAELIAAGPEGANQSAVRLVATALVRLGSQLEPVAEWSSAETCYRLAVDLRERRLDQGVHGKRLSREMLVALNHLADATWSLERPEEATEIYARALSIARRLYSAQPESERAVQDLVATGLKLGDARRELGDTVRAEAAYEEAASGVRALLPAARLGAELLRHAVLIASRLADMQRANGKLRAALETYRERTRLEARLAVLQPQGSQGGG